MTADAAKQLLIRQVAVTYPDAARNAKIQGDVALDVVVGVSGDVQEVSVVSGDALLARAASESVKQWKYKPYMVDGKPAEIETAVTFHFTIGPESQSKPPADPPLGHFWQGTYSNGYFGISYSLSNDWIRETEVMRKKFAEQGFHGAYVLLAAVYIPHHSDRVDSSFTLLAVNAGTADCRQYLESLWTALASRKDQGSPQLNQLSIAGRQFLRADMEPHEGLRYRSLLCSQAPDYLLVWNSAGATRKDTEIATATLASMSALPVAAGTPPPPTTTPTAVAADSPEKSSTDPDMSKAGVPERVKISQGVSTGLLVKRVQPSYPAAARNAWIQGVVVLQAEISKTGDVIDLEAVQGPTELIVSAVDAVRQWKYRPYLFKGEPVAVQTQIVVNYTLSR